MEGTSYLPLPYSSYYVPGRKHIPTRRISDIPLISSQAARESLVTQNREINIEKGCKGHGITDRRVIDEVWVDLSRLSCGHPDGS